MPSKHIEVEKLDDGSFSFVVMAIPDDIPRCKDLYNGGLKPLKSVELDYNGNTYFVYYDAFLSEEDVEKFKIEWDNNGPDLSNMVFRDLRLK